MSGELRLTTRAWKNRLHIRVDYSLYRLPPRKYYHVYIALDLVPITTHTHVRRNSIRNKKQGKYKKRKEKKKKKKQSEKGKESKDKKSKKCKTRSGGKGRKREKTSC